jgi:hypothetical protein
MVLAVKNAALRGGTQSCKSSGPEAYELYAA